MVNESIRSESRDSHSPRSRKPGLELATRKTCASRVRKSAARRDRIENRGNGTDPFAWSKCKPHHGYIRHPDAKWLMHPTFFDDSQPLCDFNASCPHDRPCGETRLLMATFSYLRNQDVTSFRDMEAIWGVSRSTIQRKTKRLEGLHARDLHFLLWSDEVGSNPIWCNGVYASVVKSDAGSVAHDPDDGNVQQRVTKMDSDVSNWVM